MILGRIFALLVAACVGSSAFAQTAPLVILATGQSNFVLTPAYSWTPNPKATLWNFNDTDGNIGTAFVPISNSTVNVTWKIASDMAQATGRPVCLINVSFSGMSISHWLPGTAAPDIYQNLINNVPPALAACGGATKIDLALWWQGEGDTGPGGNGPINSAYDANFASVISRLQGNTWFPTNIPIIIHGLESSAESGFSGFDGMNALLLAAVNADPAHRSFVQSNVFQVGAYWDSTNPAHMTGAGYFSAGELAANTYLAPNYIESVIPQVSAVPLTSGHAQTVTNLPLPAGNWDVDIFSYFNNPSALASFTQWGVSLSSAINTLDLTPGKFNFTTLTGGTSPGASAMSIDLPAYHVVGPANVLMLSQATSTYPATAWGIIRARRAP